jgi:hypothetical protein
MIVPDTKVSRMRTVRCSLLMLCLASVSLVAMEVVGDPPAFLSTTCKPSWRLVPLASAFDDIARISKAEVQRSEQAQKIEQQLLLVSNKELTLQAVLTQLEHCTEVRFSVNGKTIRIEHRSEFDQRRREVHWYPLSDYGLLNPVIDATPITLGFARGPRIGGQHDATTPLAEDVPAVHSIDREQLVEFIRNHADGSWENDGVGIDGRGTGPILDFNKTPEAHARIREALAEVRERIGQPKRWQVTMGLLAKDEHIPTGIVTRALAQGIAPRLTSTTTLNLSGIPRQWLRASQLVEQSSIVTVDVVDHQLDAQLVAVVKGRSATLCAVRAFQGTLVHLDLAWVEDAEKPHATAVRSTSAEVATTTGVQIPLTLPALWTWRPDVECLIPTGQALVLSSEHPSGQAVMVVEELP